jgi:hypothetical protein
VAPAGFNVLILMLAIGLAVAVGAVLAVVDNRRDKRPAPTLVVRTTEVPESKRRAA